MALDWQEFRKKQTELKGKFGGNQPRKSFNNNKGPQPWTLRMKYFSPSETPTRIRLVPLTKNDAFYTYYNRWHDNLLTKKRVPVISNSQNGAFDVPDLVYYNAVEEGNDPKLLASPTYAISVVVLETFHKIENKSAKGTVWYDYARCSGVNRFGKTACTMCQEKVPTVFGQQKYWSMSNSVREDLERVLGSLKTRCANCCVGEAVEAYMCSKCDKVVADCFGQAISDEDLDTLRNHALECPHCSERMRAVIGLSCVVPVGTTTREGCSSPRLAAPVASVFDYDITIASTKTPNSSILGVTSFTPQVDHELPGFMKEPMPFATFLSHMTLDEQSRAMGIANPFGNEGEKAVEDFFANLAQPRQAAPSAASSEEADAASIPWDK